MFQILLLASLLTALSFTATSQCVINQQFAKTFTGIGYADQNSLLQLSDRSMIAGGPVNSNFLLLKTNYNGNLLWSRTYSATNTPVVGQYTQTLPDVDGSLVSAFDNNYLARIDTAGNVQKTIRLIKASGSYKFYDLKVLSNGDKLLLLQDMDATINSYVMVRVSSSLTNVVWTKYFGAPDSYYHKLLIDGEKILVAGFVNYKASILCFDAPGGNLVKQSSFNVANRNNTIINIFKYNGGYLVLGVLYVGGGPPEDNNMVIRLSPDLQPVSASRFINIDRQFAVTLLVQPDGSYYGWFGWNTSNLMYVNNNDQVVWSRSNNVIPGSSPLQLIKNENGLIISSRGPNFAPGMGGSSWYFGLAKSDLNGNFLNCPTTNQQVSTVPLSFANQPLAVQAKDTALFTIGAATTVVTNTMVTENTTCLSTVTCTSIKIIGSNTICSAGPVSFKARRSSGCTLPVSWNLRGDSTVNSIQNDSTVSIRFVESGTYKLFACLKGGCGQIIDSLTLNVTALPANGLYLGDDTAICGGGSIELKAGKGFSSYVWQDQSADSIYRVVQAGTYSVSVKDVCGSTYRDTINITNAPPIPFDLGEDLIKCNDSSVTISAPQGFLNYSWSPAVYINSTTNKTVIVNPPADQVYTVVAEKTAGCFASDSVKVLVYRSPAINLGPDKNICIGDSVLLNAGRNFEAYQWSTGETTPTISVKSTGTFAVTGFTMAGCQSKDTVNIVGLLDKPFVELGNDTSLCVGQSRILDAGRGFESYVWNDGSTTQTIRVYNLNTYSVQVKDNNGCVGGDTLLIKRLNAQPANFLPPKVELCSDSLRLVQPFGSYQSYLWNTGARTKGITINQPGTYWLEVTDRNGCSGRDSMFVGLTRCNKGFFIPNVFTPNRDGKNDVFRPLLYGRINNYQFSVYNRWGQKVFQSTTPLKGWDGNTNESSDRSAVYVWICTYQLDDEAVKTEKGTVMLLR